MGSQSAEIKRATRENEILLQQMKLKAQKLEDEISQSQKQIEIWKQPSTRVERLGAQLHLKPEQEKLSRMTGELKKWESLIWLAEENTSEVVELCGKDRGIQSH